jgi:hemerythrin-like domain-containing protein
MPSCHDHLLPVDLTRPSAVSILSGEHRVILQVITCLERMAAQTTREGRIPAGYARSAIEVIRTFADRCHHGKEEDILFPALEAQVPGFGPTAVMREEHVIGRQHVAAMDTAIDAADVEGFVAAATGYTELLRAHIAKEDDILFRMAQAMMSPAQDAAILEAYRAVEHDDMGDGTHERLLGIADSIADVYGVERASNDPQTFALLTAVCGCHTGKA